MAPKYQSSLMELVCRQIQAHVIQLTVLHVNLQEASVKNIC